MLLASTEGNKTMHLPEARNVMNLRTKELLGNGITTITVAMKQGETLLLEMR